MDMGKVLMVLGFCGITLNSVFSQTTVPFNQDNWEIDSRVHHIAEYLGKEALYLVDGIAYLKGAEWQNGIIEFDIAFPGMRGFAGINWRMTDRDNMEYFYVRPHQSGKPDANQYTPEFNGVTGWQLYHGPGYSAPTVYPYNEWIHIKIVSWEDQAQIFIGDLAKPAIEVAKLKREPVPGGISIQSFVTPAYFADFSYRELTEKPFENITPQKIEVPDNPVMHWEVSTPFNKEDLLIVNDLKTYNTESLTWQNLPAERTGITNLARLHGVSDEANTVFARVTVVSNTNQIKKMRYGYSDEVMVYLNDNRIYSGQNSYRSRDFRYLGTIGLFDELYLPLKKGENHILFAVTENFGGWGIIAAFEDIKEIEIIEP